MNEEYYKQKYLKYKAKYAALQAAGSESILVSEPEVTLESQTEIKAHPILGIRPRNPIAKIYKAKSVVLQDEDFEKTNGTYLSLWIDPTNKNDVKITCGTGAYPQDTLHQTIEPKVGPNSDPQAVTEWLNSQKSKDKLHVIVNDNEIKDREVVPGNTEILVGIASQYNINLKGSHIMGKINTFDSRKMGTLENFFKNLRESVGSGLLFSANNNALVKEMKVTDFRNKMHMGWVKAPYKLDVILQDEIVKMRAVVTLKPEQCVAYFN
jgi:hypothetical protein